MSYRFAGIITDALEKELRILAFPYPFHEHGEPQRLIVAEIPLPYEEAVKLARTISGKLTGRQVAVLDYATWAGSVSHCRGCVLHNGVVVQGSVHAGEDAAGAEAFMRVMLEFGVVIPENGYFAPFAAPDPGPPPG